MTNDTSESTALWKGALAGLVGLVAAAAIYLLAFGRADAPRWQGNHDEHRAGPRSERAVLWVGHSLMNHRDPHIEGAPNLLEELTAFAEAKGQQYRFFDHTLFGAPLSLLWRGEPHSYDRPEFQMPEQWNGIDLEAYDTLVITEGITISATRNSEHSSYYLQQYYCAAGEHGIQVYFMEGSPHLHASDESLEYPEPDAYNYELMVQAERPVWDAIADEAASGAVPAPGYLGRVLPQLGVEERQCASEAPIFIMPIASAWARLHQELRGGLRVPLNDGTLLSFDALFQNAYIDWPAEWPLELNDARANDHAATIAGLHLRHPSEDPDDIHPSRLGTYFSGLVAYATLYRQSPEGLPGPAVLSEEGRVALQRVAWNVVSGDSRTGVEVR